jgi:predicted ATP-grasp superfamily ATP-dependent carboligase
VVAKALDPVALGARPGAKSVTITQTPAELLAAYAAAEVEGRANVMLQEHIPGRSDTVWMFNGYFDEDSRCLFGGTARKVRQYPPYSGMTVLGTCVRNDTVSRMACDLLRETGYRGIVDLGFRYDARDGTYKLLDVNPRIGATFRLFVSSGGMDVARAQYLDLTGRPVRPHTLEDGRSWIVETNDPASALRYWADGTLTAGEWVRSLRGVRESAYLAADDLAPTLAAYRWHLGLALGRLRRKVTQPTE